MVIHDEEFAGLLEKCRRRDRILGWVDDPDRGDDSLESLIASGSPREHDAACAGQPGRSS